METILTILLPLTFLLAFGAERLFPARPLPKVSWWVLKGFVWFIVTGAVNTVVPAIAAGAVAPYTPLHLEKLGVIPGAILVILASETIAYCVHRGMHNSSFIWRWTHQMHHSAERLDVAGAVYFHPFDIALQAGLPTIPVTLLGVSPDAAALGGFILFAAAMFQHTNIRTPRWLGWFIQRPEQHSVHHARGVHAYNYGNFTFMDLLFGTLRNPKDFVAEQGFYEGGSARVGAMLLGRDITSPAQPSLHLASSKPASTTPSSEVMTRRANASS